MFPIPTPIDPKPRPFNPPNGWENEDPEDYDEDD